MSRPSLGNWNDKKPADIERDPAAIAEELAWSAVDQLTAGTVAYVPIVVRPMALATDGSIRLDRPVSGVVQVKEDGVVLPLSSWRFDDPNMLERVDGNQWNANTDLTQGSNEDGVTEVTYYHGWRPGKLLVWAAAELAAEFYRAASGDKKCRLPKNVTAITRQGVSFEMSSPIFDNGRTGIHEIDVVMQRYNPHGLRSGARVVTPESMAASRRVG